MNGIEKITERIAVDTEREVQAVLADAKAQAAKIVANYEALADAEYEQVLAKGKADAEDRIVRLGGVAELEAKTLRLATRQEMLGKAFDVALEQLLAMPEQDYVDLLTKLAVDASVTGTEALVLSVADRPRYGKRVVLAANKKLEASGRTAALTLSEESREFSGGLYIQDGKIENNCTFPTIIRMLKEQMAGEVARVLFD